MQAFFLPVGDSRRFCLYREAIGSPSTPWVYVHPFAEEMNLSRRMAALQARAFAAAGHAVLQIDLFGCGDSDGDFGDADWDTWIDDVVAATDWLAQTTGQTPGLWGLRAGCLLAAEAAKKMAVLPAGFLFWQPVSSGEFFWRQFQRLGLTGAIVAGKERRKSLAAPDLDQEVEVAGYRVSPSLAAGLSGSTLDLPAGAGNVACIEIGATADVLSAGLNERCEDWRGKGWTVSPMVISGPRFWIDPEVEDCNELIGTSLTLLGRCR
jgi:exosortase A-associated hydrolase 2